MNEVRTTITVDQKPELTSLVRRLPAILCGRRSDEHGIASGFRSRIGFAILSLVGPNFDELGRGMTGADGTKWPKLTRAYLAYGRRFGQNEQRDLKQSAGLGSLHSLSPDNKKGLLTPDQLKLWRRTFAHYFAIFVMRVSDQKAKAHAAAVAWLVVKEAGGKTKLEVFGNRQVQMLVDDGNLRGSLQPGTLAEYGVDAHHDKPSDKGGQDQVFEIQEPYRVVVGSNVKYAKYHHTAKSIKRRRRLWPEVFPGDWWQEIIGQAVVGLLKIQDLFANGGRL